MATATVLRLNLNLAPGRRWRLGLTADTRLPMPDTSKSPSLTMGSKRLSAMSRKAAEVITLPACHVSPAESWPSSCSDSLRITRAGFPPTTTPPGTSLVTTAPAPTVTSSPMLTPGSTIALPPSQHLLPIRIGLANSRPVRQLPRTRGWTGCPAV